MLKALLLTLLFGCGPSAAQLATARGATYATSAPTAFQAALDAAAENYKIRDVDDYRNRFTTVPRDYSPEGDLESPGADNFTKIRGGSIELNFFVEVVATDNGTVAVHVMPKTFQYLSWSPKPRELSETDPNLPPWVLGRRDALAYAIYERLKPTAR